MHHEQPAIERAREEAGQLRERVAQPVPAETLLSTGAEDRGNQPSEPGLLRRARQRLREQFGQQAAQEGWSYEERQMRAALPALRRIDRQRELLLAKFRGRQRWFGTDSWLTAGLKERLAALATERREVVEAQGFPAFLERQGVPAKDFFRAVERSGPEGTFGERLWRHIEALQALEAKQPGAVRALGDGFGIRLFARYPEAFLLEQLAQADEHETPYGIALYAQHDWNGALGRDSHEEVAELAEKAAEAGLRVRLVEVSGPLDAAKRFARLDQRYGEHQKIQLAVVKAHGAPRSLEMGDKEFTTDAWPRENLQRLREYFTSQPAVLLDACSTGQEEDGLAQRLADSLDADVQATGHSSQGYFLDAIERTEGGYRFRGNFYTPKAGEFWSGTRPARVFRRREERGSREEGELE